MSREIDPHNLSETENVVSEHSGIDPGVDPRGKRKAAAKEKNLLQLARGTKEEKMRAARMLLDGWNDGEDRLRNIMAQWDVNEAQKEGIVGAYIVKEKDENRAWIPLGASRQYTGSNKAARLCRRIKNQLFSDPPVPEIEGEGGSEEERERAEFSQRVLEINGKRRRADFLGTAREAFSIGDVYGSGFRHWYIDEYGGGHRPLQIMASIGIEDMEQALREPGDSPVLQFVEEGGKLSLTKPAKPRRQWIRNIKCQLLNGRNVRFIPYTCRNIDDAEGVQIGVMETWGELKRLMPELEDLPEERVEEISGARPQRYERLLRQGQFDRPQNKGDDRLCFVLTEYHKVCGRYPFGAQIIMLGEDHIVYAERWYDQSNNEPLDIPVDQFMQHFDEGNPYGRGGMGYLGPQNEVRNMLIGSLLEHLDRFNNRKQFVPYTSSYQAFQHQLGTGTYIPIPPGGEPRGEDIPPFPSAVEEMVPFITDDMEDEASLRASAQGGNQPGVESSAHANTLIEQAIVGLTELQQNTVAGIERGWSIYMQLARAFYSVPQRISWVGDDGAFKEREWVGTDLMSEADVRVKPGTLTMFSRTMKTELIGGWSQLGWIGPQEAKALVASNIQATVGARDNAHRLRVRRQLARFENGPPKGWTPPPAPDPTQQQGAGPPPEEQPDPLLAEIFKLLPVDMTPEVAQIREYEMGRSMASSRFLTFPPEWQRGLLDSYTVMRQAAGIYTLEEQQQAAQAEKEAEEADRQAQRESAQQQQETKLIEGQIKAQAEIAKTMASNPPTEGAVSLT